MNLLIPKLLFLWYVYKTCQMILVYSTVHIISVEHVELVYTVYFLFRLVREITWWEWKRIHGKNPEAPDLTDKELQERKKNMCPLHWQRKALDVLYKGMEA